MPIDPQIVQIADDSATAAQSVAAMAGGDFWEVENVLNQINALGQAKHLFVAMAGQYISFATEACQRAGWITRSSCIRRALSRCSKRPNSATRPNPFAANGNGNVCGTVTDAGRPKNVGSLALQRRLESSTGPQGKHCRPTRPRSSVPVLCSLPRGYLRVFHLNRPR